jgi:hypothetical protein
MKEFLTAVPSKALLISGQQRQGQNKMAQSEKSMVGSKFNNLKQLTNNGNEVIHT